MAPTPTKPPPPYRDFLTPSLHRHFTDAALLTGSICYAEAIWMDHTDILWSWFPIGPTGLRTLLLFLAVLAVFVLRVARLHVGPKTTSSEYNTLKQYVKNVDTVQVFLWYGFSAWFFCEVYIWSVSKDAKLGLVDPGKSYERPRLNERPVFLRTMFLILAMTQSIVHLYKDYDRVLVPSTKVSSELVDHPHGLRTGAAQLSGKAIPLLNQALIRVLLVTALGPILYVLFFRRAAWQWTLSIAKIVTSLPKSSRPGPIPPQLIEMAGRFLVHGFLLCLLWEVANSAFDIFVSQAPLKKGLPITNDSKDPNGSLLAGLKAKKELPKTCAFWELVLITNHFPERRMKMFKEIDRVGGSTWSQIFTASMGEVHAVVQRIQSAKGQIPNLEPPTQTEMPPNALPRLAGALKDENIFQKAPPPVSRIGSVGKNIGDFMKSHGQSPGADPISPRAKKLLTYGTDKILSKEQQKALSKEKVAGRFNQNVIEFVQSSFGIPFRQPFRRRVLQVILGAPSGTLGPIVNAISALSKLACYSLKEDDYGNVQRDVPNIIRTFTSTCNTIEDFIKTFEPHWTDIDFKEEAGAHSRRVEEVEEILAALYSGLTSLIGEFGEYADNLGLSVAEMRLAKEAVSRRRLAS